MNIKLTMAQALLRFLANQYLVLDGQEHQRCEPWIAEG